MFFPAYWLRQFSWGDGCPLSRWRALERTIPTQVLRRLTTRQQRQRQRRLFDVAVMTDSNASMSSLLSPGEHSFSTAGGHSLTYSVHRKRSNSNTTTADIIVVQSPVWGLGFRYLVVGLEPLQENHTLVFLHPRGTSGSSPSSVTTTTTTTTTTTAKRQHEKHDADNNDDNDNDDDEQQDVPEMSPFALARDLDDLRAHLQLSRLPTLLGHSHGGTIALAYAERFPDRVANLILLGHRLLRPTPTTDSPGDENAAGRMLRRLGDDERYDAAYRAYMSSGSLASDDDFTRFVAAIVPLYFYHPDRHAAAFRRIITAADADHHRPLSLELYRSVQRAGRRSDVRQMMERKLEDVTARTLMIFGADDAQCPTENLWATKRGIPHAQAVVLEQCCHIPWIEKPEETFSAIREFLAAL